VVVALVIILVWYGVALRFLGPKTSPSRAARIRHADADGAVVFCTNKGWAEAFARFNGGEVSPGSIREAIGPWLIALVPCVTVAPVASYIGWDYANPALYVDNGFSSPIQVWVDGVAREVAPPAKGEVGSFTMRMPRGRHVLGYSRVGAASPVTTIEANILENDRHLYNPGLMSCHYVHLAVYGSTEVSPFDRPSVPDQLLGPLPIAELYNLDRVDYWLEPAPETIRVRLTERQYRTALSRNRPCLELARRGCALRLRQDLVRCQFLAETTADVLRCIHKAEVACDREPREPFIP
jgi:hypothetical protein